MEGELGFLSPARPSRVSSERGDGRGFGSPTWSSPLGTLLESPSSRVSEGRACEDGVSGFSSPTWGSPLLNLFNTPSSGVSDDSPVGGNGFGFNSPTWGSPLESLFNSPSSCVSDSRGGGNSSSLRVSKELDSEVQKAERLLRAITERYNNCFLRLRNATAELADLRRERIRLGAENLHLSLLLEELVVAEQSNQASAVALTPPLKPVQAEAASGCAPKSISIRSKSFISPKQPRREIQPQRLRVRASPAKEVRPQIPLFDSRNFTSPRTLLVRCSSR